MTRQSSYALDKIPLSHCNAEYIIAILQSNSPFRSPFNLTLNTLKWQRHLATGILRQAPQSPSTIQPSLQLSFGNYYERSDS
jgi:hypothetical protein